MSRVLASVPTLPSYVIQPHIVKDRQRGQLTTDEVRKEMDAVAAVSQVIRTFAQLRVISEKIKNADLRNAIADLSGQLADAKLAVAELKSENAQLLDTIRGLKQAAHPTEKPTGRLYGCYRFAGDDELYCTACWDVRRTKCVTNRVDVHFRRCPACGALIGAS